MECNKRKYRLALLLFTGLSSSIAFSVSQIVNNNPSINSVSGFLSSLKYGHAVLQLGGYWSNQGSGQHINIEDLIGDEFTVIKHTGSNGLVGLGYYIDGQEKEHFNMIYGLNGFYLAKTAVKGDVIQENLFTNLSYQYNVTHYPIYAVAKALIKTQFPNHELTLDMGIGPNFVQASGFRESSLDGMTMPDNIFASHTTMTFTATVGVGLRFKQILGQAPLECGYRFFYLGQGHFNAQTSQVVNTLNTGTSYANALMCSITV